MSSKEKTFDWEKSLNVSERFHWATPEQQSEILAEIRFQHKMFRKEILSVIDEISLIQCACDAGDCERCKKVAEIRKRYES